MRVCLVLLSVGFLCACGAVLERRQVITTPHAERPDAAWWAVVRGCQRAGFHVWEEAPYTARARHHARKRVIELEIRYWNGTVEIEHVRSAGYAERGGRIHRRYYHVMDELYDAIRSELSFPSEPPPAATMVPLTMAATTSTTEVTAGRTVMTTRSAVLTTAVPAEEARHLRVSAEREPIATASADESAAPTPAPAPAPTPTPVFVPAPATAPVTAPAPAEDK